MTTDFEGIAAQVTRGGIPESWHRADVAVVTDTGQVLAAWDDPERVCFFRSSAKPLQAAAALTTGAAERFHLEEREIAVMCASHSAASMHLNAVRSILAKIERPEEALQCGPHWPGDAATTRELHRTGQQPGRIHNNCSGKHAGMLAAAVCLGADVGSYLSPGHPVQQRNLQAIAALTHVPAEGVVLGIDGCGVPTFAVPLRGVAWAFAHLARPEQAPEEYRAALATASAAMRAHPPLVSAAGEFNARLMEAAEGGIVSKGGAEGLYCLGLVGAGIGVAVRVQDGSARAIPALVLEVLRQLELVDPAVLDRLAQFRRPPVTNTRGEVVGEIVPVLTMRRKECSQ
jgi:L-asparaginase II